LKVRQHFDCKRLRCVEKRRHAKAARTVFRRVAFVANALPVRKENRDGMALGTCGSKKLTWLN